MSAKRNLPSWMDRTDRQSITNTIRNKSEESTNKDANENCPRRIVYWMNEQELVDTATNILKSDNKKSDEACTLKARETSMIPETDAEEASDSDAHERTYVSDTDLDVTEQETVPYGVCLENSSSRTRLQGAGEHSPPDLGSFRAEPKFEDSDPDDLRLVREIFFS